jgi:hypothetical protein
VISINLLQPVKAKLRIEATPFEITTDSKLLQPEKAESPIITTWHLCNYGIIYEITLSLPLTIASIFCRSSGRTADENDWKKL